MTLEAIDVARFLGQGDDDEIIALAGVHLPVVTAFVRGYTRGRGFTSGEPNEDLAHVIITATARLTINPEQNRRVSVDDYSQTYTTLDGFTLPELAILHLYRRRSA
ncbi:hypothetical protein MTQ12_13580 [Brevibacterium sp. R8603A2]|uniref:hypothetical protein n=1 Tax=Brevibacterium sp. R8603A2 TaxID=2929779 RepID=UPI001FFB6E45|nr:hypothetical protein [Brevibacterium sp. R8603A2]MCK1804067.1 hypothetical protein [Brevibacterium sp. R8603A2]